LARTAADPAVQDALKKSTIAWLRVPGDDGRHTVPVWYLYDAKASKMYVLSGERQQEVPGAESLRHCDVIFRWRGHNARIAEIPASVRVITSVDDDWTAIAEKVAEKRLNIPGPPEETAARWREECVILELTLG
jgi:hypothetical protein